MLPRPDLISFVLFYVTLEAVWTLQLTGKATTDMNMDMKTAKRVNFLQKLNFDNFKDAIMIFIKNAQ